MTWLELTVLATVFLVALHLGLRRRRVQRRRRLEEVLATAREELESDRLEARLAAISRLERVAKASARGYWEVAEILSSFLRRSTYRGAKKEAEAGAEPKEQRAPPLQLDRQMAVTVLARWRPRRAGEEEEEPSLDLSDVDLSGAGLQGAHLQGARLRNARLLRVELWRAHLQNADLSGAHLDGANLRGAVLDGANLRGAVLDGASLEDASLRGADLSGADLTHTNLTFAHLEGANLLGAGGLTAAQVASTYKNKGTKLPEGLG